ncbi:hypothetical protein [Gaiella sp.]|uniref:hypothetical protein n=1 Tax=Gaiella sp. TaxID=2663207 RepID=UPI003266FA1A
MPAGIAIGQLAGLVREIRGAEGSPSMIVISGPGAEALATALAVGGDRRAIVVDGNPAAAAVALRIVEGDPGGGERAVLRRLTSEQTPVVVIRRGGSDRIPHVFADDVVDVESENLGANIGPIAIAIARAVGAAGPALAARLPILRAPVSEGLVARTAYANAALAASPQIVPQLPMLTFTQVRMLLLVGVARGETLPRGPEGLLRAAGPSLVAALGAGVGARALVRRLPVRGRLVRAAIAYGVTRMLGTAVLRR